MDHNHEITQKKEKEREREREKDEATHTDGITARLDTAYTLHDIVR